MRKTMMDRYSFLLEGPLDFGWDPKDVRGNDEKRKECHSPSVSILPSGQHRFHQVRDKRQIIIKLRYYNSVSIVDVYGIV
jgi:hypothetical protein